MPLRKHSALTLQNLKPRASPALSFIDKTWDDLTGNARTGHHDSIESWQVLAATSMDGHLDDQDHEHPHILFLPNDYIYPGGRFVVQFYWDTYFILQALLLSSRLELAKGMIENCLYLIDTYGMVIANRRRWAAGSQLPFLALMISDMYKKTGDRAWLSRCLPLLEKELNGYWLNSAHLCHRGLSRYHAPTYFPCDAIATITMDNEATWDLSPRFDKEDVLHLLPIDLNTNLYMYEEKLAFFYSEIGDISNCLKWTEKARNRKETMNLLFWNNDDGFYYDFDFFLRTHKKVKSLAAFFPLFARIADDEKAARIRDHLSLFETPFGLVTCDRDYRRADRQWNYPIGWPPLHWIAYHGLKNYGYVDDAQRVALKWLSLTLSIWTETTKFFEKYDVVNGTEDVLFDRYKNQEGFGWTNAIFCALVEDMTAGRQ